MTQATPDITPADSPGQVGAVLLGRPIFYETIMNTVFMLRRDDALTSLDRATKFLKHLEENDKAHLDQIIKLTEIAVHDLRSIASDYDAQGGDTQAPGVEQSEEIAAAAAPGARSKDSE